MRIKKKNISVIIINFNNAKYIRKCLSSVKNQSYKDTEIIFVDDQSIDNSIKTAKKFKNIKILTTRKKTQYGSINQLNAIKLGMENAKGEILFFLDSDDFFHKKKIEIVLKYFRESINFCLDKPIIIKKNNKKKFFINQKRSKFIIPWPKFPPQSCIAIRKKYLRKVFRKISINKFYDTWFDFRIVNQNLIDNNQIFIIPEYLTYYRQQTNSISSGFRKYSINWWRRRYEAHNFLKYLYLKNNKKFNLSLDKITTSFINKII